MNILDPQTVLFATAASAAITIGLRSIFARAAMNKAIEKAAPSVAQFRVAHSAPLAEVPSKNAQMLKVLLEKGTETKDMYVGELDKLKIAKIKEPPRDRLLSQEFGEMGATMLWGAVGVELYNFSAAYGGHMQEMMKAGVQSAPVAATVNIIDKQLIETLDKLGVTNVLMETGKGISEHIPGALTDFGLEVVHELMLPGVMTTITTTINELRLSFDGENNWEDAIKYGVLPALSTYAIVKGGMWAGGKGGAIVDAHFGGASMGLGTLVGAVGGIVVATIAKDKYIGRQIEGDKDALRPHANKIVQQRATGIEAVNTVILEKAEKLNEFRAQAPDISGDKKMQDICRKLAEATVEDMGLAQAHIKTGYDIHAKDIPARSWREKILGIDTGAVLRTQYRTAANDQLEELKVTQDKLTEALKGGNMSTAVDILLNSTFLRGGKVESILQTLMPELKGTAASYDDSLKSWGHAWQTHWDKSKVDVQAELDAQNSLMETLRRELAHVINPLRMRIKNNCLRIGRAPDPLIYV